MDPNATLADLRSRLADMRRCDGKDLPAASAFHARRAAEAAEALDEWLSKGGFLPDAWAVGR